MSGRIIEDIRGEEEEEGCFVEEKLNDEEEKRNVFMLTEINKWRLQYII